jgi:hypothetical protein
MLAMFMKRKSQIPPCYWANYRLVENDEVGKYHKLWVRAGVRLVSWGHNS